MAVKSEKTVFVNVAPTLRYGGNTGIQRVVRELERHLDGVRMAGLHFEFGGLFAGRWVTARAFRAKHRTLSWQGVWERHRLRRHVPQPVATLANRVITRLDAQRGKGIRLPAGSVVVDADAGWIDEWRINHALDLRRVTLVYDLIPHSHPQFCMPEHNENFKAWLQGAIMATDASISISRSAMEACRAYAQGMPGARIQHYGYFHLGCDFDGAQGRSAVGLPGVLRPERYFLIVGSIEPRKNHRLALEAFNAYRDAGGDWDLVVVGRPGWHCDEIISGMVTSPGYGQALHWFDDADDALLARIYRDAGALIIPSHIEGFGLPLIEGAHWGRSVIASDIPVFREIGEDFANFFAPTDATHLATRMWEAQRCALPKRLVSGQAVGLYWQESVKQFAEEIARLLEGQGR